MAMKTLTPSPYQVLLDENGNPVSGGKVGTYLTGTTTPAATYADSEGLTENPNPIVCDDAGRYIAYLTPGVSYRFTFLNADDSQLYEPRDGIGAVGTAAVSTTNNGIVQGRLTLESGVPVPDSDITSAQTLYFTPDGGNAIALYDGTEWLLYTFSELSQSLTALLADTAYDVFAGASGDVVSLSVVAWANRTTEPSRDTQDGVIVQSGDPTKRWLGAFSTTSVAGRGEDSYVNRLVWNAYNQVPRAGRWLAEGGDQNNYTLSAYRQFNADTDARVAVFLGTTGQAVHVQAMAYGSNNDGAAQPFNTGIGDNSSSANATGTLIHGAASASSAVQGTAASLETIAAVGYHEYRLLQRSNAVGTCTWYGMNDNGQTGIQTRHAA